MAGQRTAADDDFSIVVGSTVIVFILWMVAGMMV